MIGIFDSGSGGLTFLAAMRRRYPEWSYLYHADYEHCPFWERPPEEIQALTIAGVQKLFDAGASIVILACNTASAWTLRKLQNETFPDKKILWVTIPGAEKVIELWLNHITVFATEQTIRSRTYAERVSILDNQISIDEIAFSGELVREIEALLPIKKCHTVEDFLQLSSLYDDTGWNCEGPQWTILVKKYFSCIQAHHDEHSPLPIAEQCASPLNPVFFSSTSSPIPAGVKTGIILGCTHYS